MTSPANRYQKAAEYLLIIALSTLLVVKGIAPAWQSVHSDFANYYVSARLVASGAPLEDLYNNEWFQQRIYEYGIQTPGKFAPFPPLTAWVMLPFASLDPLDAQRAFTIINLLFLLGGIVAIRRLTEWTWSNCALLLLASGLGITNNIAFGQMYLMMTLFILLAMLLFKDEKVLIPGFLLGFFTAFKYFPALVLVALLIVGFSYLKPINFRLRVFLKTRHLQVVLVAGITLFVLILVQYVFFGAEVMKDYFYSALLPHLDGVLHGQGLYSLQFQSWDNLFRNMFLYDSRFNPYPFLNWPSGKTTMKIIITTIVFLLAFLSLKKVRIQDSFQKSEIYIAIVSLAGLVLLPASATYHFILLLIPVVFLIKSKLLRHQTAYMILLIYLTIGLIPYGLAFKLSDSWGLFFGYPRLWLVTLLFLVVTIDLINPKVTPQAE